MSVLLEEGELSYGAESLQFSGVVVNTGDAPCRDVELVFVLPAGVGLPANAVVGSAAAGAPRNATSLPLCEVLGPEARQAFVVELPIVGKVGEIAVLASIGLASDRGSVGVGALRCSVPRRPVLRVSADIPATLSASGVARATFVIGNVGRSPARGLWLSLAGDDDLTVRGGDRDRGVADAEGCEVAILGSLEVGESREVSVHIHSRGVGRGGDHCFTASVSNDAGENLWVEAYVVTVETMPALSVVCDTVYDAEVDEFVDVEAVVCSVGNGAASAVTVEVVPRGGVRLDASAPESLLQPTFTNGRRHLRGELGDLAALSQVPVKFRATGAPSRASDPAGFDVFVSADDATTVVRHVPVEARYLFGVKGKATRFKALSGECVPGDLVRVKMAIANGGTEALEDARVRLLVSPALVVEGLQDGRSRVHDGVYYAGDIPAGVMHENVLLLRVSALPEGVTSLCVGGVLSAIGAYELPIGSAEIRGRAQSRVALESLITDGHTVRFVVANRGDAETKRVDLGVICDDGMFVEPGTTHVGEHVLVDDGGHSPLAAAGVVLGAIAPGTSIPVQLNVVSETDRVGSVTVVLRFGTSRIERSIDVKASARALLPTLAGGYTIENAVVAPSLKIEETSAIAVLSNGVPIDGAGMDLPAPIPVVPADDAAGVERTGEEALYAGDGERSAPSASTPAPGESNTEFIEHLEKAALPPSVSAGASSTTSDVVAPASPHIVDPEPPAPLLALPAATGDAGGAEPVSAAAASAEPPLTPAALVAGKPLGLVPASLEVTTPWLRGCVSGLAPLISSPARVLAMHALALRFFVPDRFLADCADDRRERIEDTLAGLRKASKTDAVRAAAFASAPTFGVTTSWLRLVDSDGVIQASRALARSVDRVLFTASADEPADNRLIAEVDVANLGATTRRFEASDAMATTWVFWNLLPTILASRPTLGEALLAYRNTLEETLYTASPGPESLKMPVPAEVDAALERVRSELIALSADRGVAART